MVGKLFGLIIFCIIAILTYATTRPSEFRVERAIVIQASADRIFPFVNDLTQWAQWSPYEKKDPAMKKTYSRPPAGTGATLAWYGNSHVGAGSMTIVESIPSSSIKIDLNLTRPLPARNQAQFVFTPQEFGTMVSWSMSGKMNIVARAVGIFVNMDALIASDFEHGLVSLQTLVTPDEP